MEVSTVLRVVRHVLAESAESAAPRDVAGGWSNFCVHGSALGVVVIVIATVVVVIAVIAGDDIRNRVERVL